MTVRQWANEQETATEFKTFLGPNDIAIFDGIKRLFDPILGKIDGIRDA